MSAETVDRVETGAANLAWARSAWECDLKVAATWSVPVLISAGPAESQEIARKLSRRGGFPRPALRTVDCRQGDAGGAVASLAGGHAQSHAPEVVLFLEVHALSPADQSILEGQLEDILLRREGDSPVRVLASSSMPLFEKVLQHAFQERLYYLLNMIHIKPPSRPRS